MMFRARSARRTVALVAGIACVLGGLTVVAPSAEAHPAKPNPVVAHPAKAHPGPRLPAVFPAPQSMTSRRDGFQLTPVVDVVAGHGTDAPAVQATVDILHAAGVREVRRLGDDKAPTTPVTVFVGGAATNRQTAAALRALGVTGPSESRPEGYLLAAGRGRDGRARIVLAGVDGTGTFYAAQTLRQLISSHPGRPRMPGVVVTDWPAFANRGAMEVHYGPVWSQQDRLDQLRFDGTHKLDTFVYGPVEDPYADYLWRTPYPADQLGQLAALVRAAKDNHVNFIYSFNPSTRTGSSAGICYSSDADFAALTGKMQQMWDVGVRQFALAFDDISKTFDCPGDTALFGRDVNPQAAGQAHVINRIVTEFVDAHPGAKPLIVVPTDYSQAGTTPYRQRFAQLVDPRVIVYWTGIGVVARTITGTQATQQSAIFNHQLLVWDNYPVNDYNRNRLFLGPVTGRTADLAPTVAGFTANTMNEEQASQIPLSTDADYTWNPAAYDPERSFDHALRVFGGPAYEALKIFAENSRAVGLDGAIAAPTLTALVDRFWAAYNGGGDLRKAAAALGAYFAKMSWAVTDLRRHLPDQRFLDQASGYLDKLAGFGATGADAVDLILAQRAGHGTAAWKDRSTLEAGVAQLLTNPKQMTNGVADTFLAKVSSLSGKWLLGPGPDFGTPTTTMGTWSTYSPNRMVDGDPASFYWSSRAPAPGDAIGVDLGRVEPIAGLNILMTTPPYPNEYVHNGIVEASADGHTWTQLAVAHNQPEIHLTVPSTPARYVRLRDTGTQTNWLMAREFDVLTSDSLEPTVSGSPAAGAGSSLAAAVDGNVDSLYAAGAAPQPGDALVVTLPKARPLDGVEILADSSHPPKATVQLKTGNRWRDVGRLTGGYTQLETHGVTSDHIRLLWDSGSPAPRIYEIVPWYSDTPPVTLAVDPAETAVEAGTTAQTVVRVASASLHDQTGGFGVTGPAGWQLSPTHQHLVVHRGDELTVPVSAAVPASAATGTHVVVAHYRSRPAAETDWSLDVYPPVSDTNIAPAGTASASSVVQNLPQFQPNYVNDADMATRWASEQGSGYDDAWVQVKLAAPARVGEVVLHWETAYGAQYAIQGSTDGMHWQALAENDHGQGGTETLHMDSGQPISYLRMQGIQRVKTSWGYSLWEMQIYPVRP